VALGCNSTKLRLSNANVQCSLAACRRASPRAAERRSDARRVPSEAARVVSEPPSGAWEDSESERTA
jgi:hypothetical protein